MHDDTTVQPAPEEETDAHGDTEMTMEPRGEVETAESAEDEIVTETTVEDEAMETVAEGDLSVEVAVPGDVRIPSPVSSFSVPSDADEGDYDGDDPSVLARLEARGRAS